MRHPGRRRFTIRKNVKEGHGAMHELNITPLLDLVFVLLVIFIITTPQMANDLEMNLPSGQQKKPNGPPPKIHRVVIDPQGGIRLNQQAVAMADLKGLFVGLRKTEGDPSVVVSGGSEVDYERVIGVLDLLQQADITKVGLATETAR